VNEVPGNADPNEYKHVEITRRDAVIQVRMHTDNGPLHWGAGPHGELPRVFHKLASDRDASVVILTGTGEHFIGPRGGAHDVPGHARLAPIWEQVHSEGLELIDSLLRLPMPVIGAINGPAYRHSEIGLLSDIILCSDTSVFEDSGHFITGLAPGDGVNVITPHLIGLGRARYFHLTGQSIPADLALQWGMVNEVLPGPELLPRAWELAQQVAQQPRSTLRHVRLLNTFRLRREMLEMIGYGTALEGLEVSEAFRAGLGDSPVQTPGSSGHQTVS